MKTAEIVSVGEELLQGDVVDTNAAWLSRELKEIGFSLRFRQTCGDCAEELRATLDLALSRSHLVVVTGGLGPTYDDITRDVTAELFGVALLRDERVAQKLKAYFQRRGMEMSENNLRQAQVPQGARILDNDWGTAPGLWLEGEKGIAILLPGVPGEMKAIFKNRVLPLLERYSGEARKTEILHFYGIAESRLDEELFDLATSDPSVMIAPYAGGGEVELHVTAAGANAQEASQKCERAIEEILARVGDHCYGRGEVNLEKALVEACASKGIRVATAESCTGGLVSRRITSVPGASRVFPLGLCTYLEEEKVRRLGVRSETLSRFGVYSKECALEMAEGICALSGAELGIGVTGIAGPDGGTEENPVGTVYIAVVFGEKKNCIRTVLGHRAADRDWICRLASSKALDMARALIL
ncbi:MAG: competence/damage-inducible protein A [Clostridia bacterium]|nr:competence/damage-inducible protein A [Clostridia bacterium]